MQKKSKMIQRTDCTTLGLGPRLIQTCVVHTTSSPAISHAPLLPSWLLSDVLQEPALEQSDEPESLEPKHHVRDR